MLTHIAKLTPLPLRRPSPSASHTEVPIFWLTKETIPFNNQRRRPVRRLASGIYRARSGKATPAPDARLWPGGHRARPDAFQG